MAWVVCPHCGMRVLANEDGRCPSCGHAPGDALPPDEAARLAQVPDEVAARAAAQAARVPVNRSKPLSYAESVAVLGLGSLGLAAVVLLGTLLLVLALLREFARAFFGLF